MTNIVKVMSVVGLLTASFFVGGLRSERLAQATPATDVAVRRPADVIGSPTFIFPVKYGYDTQGTLDGYGPFVVNGVLTFNTDGTITAVETVNLAGQILHDTYTGSYTVNPDDTGSVTTIDQNGGVSHFAVVFTAHRLRATMLQDDMPHLIRMEQQ